MTELPGGIPLFRHAPHEQLIAPAEQTIPEQPEPASPEEVRAVDAVFAQDHDSNLAGLLAVWTGTMLLADMAQEHLQVPAEAPTPSLPEEKDEAIE